MEDSNPLQKGMLFGTNEDLQMVVKKYCVTQHYQIVVVESKQNMWHVKCKLWKEGCDWRLRACRHKTYGY